MLNKQLHPQINVSCSRQRTPQIFQHHQIISFATTANIQVSFLKSFFNLTYIQYLDDFLNENSNMSTVSLSSKIWFFLLRKPFNRFCSIALATIVNAALQSNTSRLRLDWLDNVCLVFYLHAYRHSRISPLLDVWFIIRQFSRFTRVQHTLINTWWTQWLRTVSRNGFKWTHCKYIELHSIIFLCFYLAGSFSYRDNIHHQ